MYRIGYVIALSRAQARTARSMSTSYTGAQPSFRSALHASPSGCMLTLPRSLDSAEHEKDKQCQAGRCDKIPSPPANEITASSNSTLLRHSRFRRRAR